MTKPGSIVASVLVQMLLMFGFVLRLSFHRTSVIPKYRTTFHVVLSYLGLILGSILIFMFAYIPLVSNLFSDVFLCWDITRV